MKKLIILMALPLLFACSAEDGLNCNCGLVVRDNVQNYSVVIRNSCSSNEQLFYLQPGDWMNAFVGSNYCITNANNWKVAPSK